MEPHVARTPYRVALVPLAVGEKDQATGPARSRRRRTRPGLLSTSKSTRARDALGSHPRFERLA